MRKVYLSVVCILILSLIGWKTGMFVKVEKRVREPSVAGIFYPSEGLDRVLEDLFSKTKYRNYGKLRALIVPHAGYVFSGEVAAEGFKQVPKDVKTVLILGPSHHVYFPGASISDYTHYRTPIGEVRVSDKARILKNKGFLTIDDVGEHSIEVELPFLQKVLSGFEIVPIMVGYADPKRIAEDLIDLIDDETLIVVSTDFSHYHPYEEAKMLDKKCIGAIEELNIEEVRRCEACGRVPILTLLHIAKEFGWYPYLLKYKNSGDVTGNLKSVVGYAAIGFYEGIDKDNQKTLLRVARKVLTGYFKEGKIDISTFNLPLPLREKKGCFVTLYKRGMLRGCIGTVLPTDELYACVIKNTINAAVNDLRFPPLTEEELSEIRIEISVLTPPKKLEFKSVDELLSRLDERYGVIIRKGSKQATYLPQVWEKIQKKEEFLSSLCLKAGLSEECWRDEKIEVEVYQAQVFSEEFIQPLSS